LDSNSIFKVNIRISELAFKTEGGEHDDEKYRTILKFFFDDKKQYIDELEMNDQIRCLSQAFLIEAVDRSYAYGYVNMVYNTFFMQPPTGLKSIIAQFTVALKDHWFKNASAATIRMGGVCIYENVRLVLKANFSRGLLEDLINSINQRKPYVAILCYPPFEKNALAWRLS